MTDSTTIEVMLTPQQLSALSNGSKSPEKPPRRSRTSRVLVGAAAAVALVVAGSLAHLTAKQKQAAPLPVVAHASMPLPPVAPPAEVAPPTPEPVLFANPFDHSEVFEFPPGTPEAEARDTVAQMLIDRAHGRGPGVLKLRVRKAHHSAESR